MNHHRSHRLWHFHGGLHVEDHKAVSTQSPIQEATLPKKLIIPVSQHIGTSGVILVNIGDKVGKGQQIVSAQGEISTPLHASTSGTVTAIETRPVPHPSGLKALCIEITADGRDEWIQNRNTHIDDFDSLPPQTLRALIREAGIVGLGGAAFPTAVKLDPDHQSHIDTLIINGAECEPWISCDDVLMREHAADIIHGITIIQHLVTPQQTLIGIEDNKPHAIAAMRAAIYATKLETCEVVIIPTLYPSGGEKQLIHILTGKEVPSGGLPMDIGIVCQNVGTAYAVQQAIVQGQPLIERVMTITGDGVQQPQNLRVRIGTPVSDLVQQAGGYNNEVSRLIMGGPMMGFTLGSDEAPIIKSSNCILAASSAIVAAPDQARACIRCGECTKVCPAQLLPQQMYWHTRARNFDKVQDYHLFDCIECGCCAHVCPSHIPLVQYYRFAKNEIWHQEREKIKSDLARERHNKREERLERAAREKAERLAKKKAALKKTTDNKAEDPKKAAIQAALDRVKAKKSTNTPKNTKNLAPQQQVQIDIANQRRSTRQEPENN
jgi:electron transport complex protein RnfC